MMFYSELTLVFVPRSEQYFCKWYVPLNEIHFHPTELSEGLYQSYNSNCEEVNNRPKENCHFGLKKLNQSPLKIRVAGILSVRRSRGRSVLIALITLFLPNQIVEFAETGLKKNTSSGYLHAWDFFSSFTLVQFLLFP